LEGGAGTIGNNYILKGQDTIYLEKFNVDANSPYGLYNHQYMQNIQAPASESSSTKRMYAGAGSLDSGFVFKIPVYQNMPGEKPIKSIALDKTEVILYRPDTIAGNPSEYHSAATLNVSINPSDTTDDKTITWTSSNPKAVSVKAGENTQTAVITALAAGDVTITAKSQNNKTAKCTVHVEAPIYSLRIANLNTENDAPDTSATLYAGQSLTLTADYLPKDTTSDTRIVWSSLDPSVADVDAGKVTAHKKGSTTITATVAGFSAGYEIIVGECTVRFLDANGNELKTVTARYGSSIPAEDFPQLASTAEKQFIGWYTKKDGQGTQFDPDTLVYADTVVLYPYFEEQGKGFYVIPVGDKTYTGAPIRPEVLVYDSIRNADGSFELIQLIQGQDYTVTYKNNKDVNTSANKTPTITVKGKGNYSGTESVTFDILPKPLTDHDITADNVSVAYNSKVQKALPAVYRDGKKLANKKDYVLTYPYEKADAYKNAGVYPIVIKGTKNYSGTITVYETISKKTMLSKVSVAKIPNQAYRNELVDKNAGKGIIPDKLTVSYKNQPLTPSTDGGKTGDYTVSYKNNTAIGTATATITATEGSAFAGSKNITYKIVGTNINKASVTGITSKTYTGSETDVRQNTLTLVSYNCRAIGCGHLCLICVSIDYVFVIIFACSELFAVGIRYGYGGLIAVWLVFVSDVPCSHRQLVRRHCTISNFPGTLYGSFVVSLALYRNFWKLVFGRFAGGDGCIVGIRYRVVFAGSQRCFPVIKIDLWLRTPFHVWGTDFGQVFYRHQFGGIILRGIFHGDARFICNVKARNFISLFYLSAVLVDTLDDSRCSSCLGSI